MKKFVALLLAILALGCWGLSSASAGELGFYAQGGVNLDGPSYVWWYGCSPTSAGMMMGYYDQKGYDGKSYGNLVSGGTAESTTFPLTSPWNALVKTSIASQGYVNDYYRYANGTPDLTNGGDNSGSYLNSQDDQAATHTPNCLADYMGSGQDWATNSNGSTWFWYVTGGKYYAKDAYAGGHYLVRNGIMEGIDGMLGMDLYFRSRGYGTGNIADDMNFYTWTLSTSTYDQGCTFSDYKALIDAGLVAMIQVQGPLDVWLWLRRPGEHHFATTPGTDWSTPWPGEGHIPAWADRT